MSLTYTSKGNPVMKIGKFQLSFTSTDNSKDKWKWVVVSTGNERDIAPLTLLGLKAKVVPAKLKNRMKKFFKKYSKDGYIHKDSIDKLYKDLKIMDEGIVTRLDDMMDLLL
jgi:hypothetical protein